MGPGTSPDHVAVKRELEPGIPLRWAIANAGIEATPRCPPPSLGLEPPELFPPLT